MTTIHAENNGAQTLVTTAETAVLAANTFESYGGSGGTYSGGQASQPVPAVINVVVNAFTGTGATALTVRLRHGVNSLTGALVGNAVGFSVAAGNTVSIPVEFLDTTGDLNGYTVTVQQTGATANGGVNSVAMDINPQ